MKTFIKIPALALLVAPPSCAQISNIPKRLRSTNTDSKERGFPRERQSSHRMRRRGLTEDMSMSVPLAPAEFFSMPTDETPSFVDPCTIEPTDSICGQWTKKKCRRVEPEDGGPCTWSPDEDWHDNDSHLDCCYTPPTAGIEDYISTPFPTPFPTFFPTPTEVGDSIPTYAPTSSYSPTSSHAPTGVN